MAVPGVAPAGVGTTGGGPGLAAVTLVPEDVRDGQTWRLYLGKLVWRAGWLAQPEDDPQEAVERLLLRPLEEAGMWEAPPPRGRLDQRVEALLLESPRWTEHLALQVPFSSQEPVKFRSQPEAVRAVQEINLAE